MYKRLSIYIKKLSISSYQVTIFNYELEKLSTSKM